MKGTYIWFLLSCKRYLKKGTFLLILLVLPVLTLVVHRLEKREGQEIRIAVCAEQGGEAGRERGRSGGALEEELAEALVRREETDGKGLFRFYRCDSEEEVKAQVASRQAECGYVISRDLRQRLDEKNMRRCIRVYSAPSTVLAELSTEVVFASLMKLYDREIFLDYVMESEMVKESGEEVEELAGNLYDKWMGNGSTFRFDYHYLSRGTEKEEEGPNASIFPVRGIVAVYLFLTGLYSAVTLGNDEKKGLFLPLLPGEKWMYRLAVLGAPVFLAALSALGALKTGGCLKDMGRELLVLGGYGAAVCVFAYGVKLVFRTPQAVCCLIPFFLAGSFIFTPVFVDISQYFPAWGWIERLFLPAYYLRMF